MDTSSDLPATACNSPAAESSHEETMKLLGDFWTLRIIDTVSGSELRYGELEKALPRSNPVTLSGRLKRLEEAGIINRACETRDKQSVTYCLTEKGAAILPIIAAIKAYAVQHSNQP